MSDSTTTIIFFIFVGCVFLYFAGDIFGFNIFEWTFDLIQEWRP